MKIIYLCNYYDITLKLKNFKSLNPGNQQNDILNLIIRDNFDQKLKNFSNNLQNLTFGHNFNQSLNSCVMLPKLQNLTLNTRYDLEIPLLFLTQLLFMYLTIIKFIKRYMKTMKVIVSITWEKYI